MQAEGQAGPIVRGQCLQIGRLERGGIGGVERSAQRPVHAGEIAHRGVGELGAVDEFGQPVAEPADRRLGGRVDLQIGCAQRVELVVAQRPLQDAEVVAQRGQQTSAVGVLINRQTGAGLQQAVGRC